MSRSSPYIAATQQDAQQARNYTVTRSDPACVCEPLQQQEHAAVARVG
jgi:hypothetical protein